MVHNDIQKEGEYNENLDRATSCKGCESAKDPIYSNGFCGFCQEDIENGLRDEDSGDLNEREEGN